MYPSILIIPPTQVIFAILKHIYGPRKTIQISHQTAQFMISLIPEQTHAFTPDNLKLEMKIISRMSCPPWIACFETACAFEQWLAIHGETSQICIGKRLENGRLLMHAWVQTKSASFFRDNRFVKCFA